MSCKITKPLKHLPIEHWHYQSITSTQTYAKQIELIPNVWRLISADIQTAGHGQMGRTWISNQYGNIYATLIVPLEIKYINSSRVLPQITAFSIIQILQSKGFNAKLKWVNDVLINKKKVGGVLCEQSHIRKLQLQKLLIGFGVNVNASEDMFSHLDQPATSLFIESGTKIGEIELLYAIVEMIYENFQLFYLHGFKYFLTSIINLLAYKDGVVCLELNSNLTKGNINIVPNNKVFGRLIGLDEDGSLILSTLDGEIKKFNHGRIKNHANS